MKVIGESKRALVVAPHPDDEVLGVGGTIAKLTGQEWKVSVCIVTKGDDAFPKGLIERGRREASRVHLDLGVCNTVYLDLPAAKLDQLPHHVLNARLAEVMEAVRPEIVLFPFWGDIHRDHRLVAESVLVVTRPHGTGATLVAAYETLSETNWGRPLSNGFEPDMFVDITDQLSLKLEAVSTYKSQMQRFPHERSVEAVRHLAHLRGAEVGRRAAEAFVSVRHVL